MGLGDLVAGGGDCRVMWGKNQRGLAEQLEELRREILERLKVPFVPVAGNHDLESRLSQDRAFAARVWRDFWKQNERYVLEQARTDDPRASRRFEYRGVGFGLVTYYGWQSDYGLHQAELSWLDKNLRPGDLVFRHVNPYGISCESDDADECGFAIRNTEGVDPRRLTEILGRRRIGALFSGHTHAFYDGECSGLRFVNTGALGERAMEYLRGWKKSPYRKKQAFVWVDVYSPLRLAVSFRVWNDAKRNFERFDTKHFPPAVIAQRIRRRHYEEGVEAVCLTTGHPRNALATLLAALDAHTPAAQREALAKAIREGAGVVEAKTSRQPPPAIAKR